MGDPASLAGADPASARVRRFLVAAAVICVLGAFLRVFVYAANLSLWLDEALLSLNLIRRGPRELLDPLWWDQGAPPLFLLAERSAVQILGEGEWALRLLPLIAGLASLPLFAVLARRVLGSGPFALFAIALFALSVPLARYAAEVKQYGLDVLVALIIVLPATAILRRSLRPVGIVAVALTGGLLTLVSFTAALVTAGVLIAVVAVSVERRDFVGAVTGVGLAVAGGAAGVAYVRWAAPPEGLRDRVAGAFRAAEQSPVETASRYLQVTGAEFRWAIVASGVLALAGVIALVLRDRPVFWLLTGPFLAAFAADIAGVYPFYQRFSLFTVPFALLLIAIGARAIWDLDVIARVPAVGLCAVVAAGSVVHAGDTVAYGPQWDSRQDLRPVLEEVAAERQAGDVIWIYPAAPSGSAAAWIDRGRCPLSRRRRDA